jgi:hypothetical protein
VSFASLRSDLFFGLGVLSQSGWINQELRLRGLLAFDVVLNCEVCQSFS